MKKLIESKNNEGGKGVFRAFPTIDDFPQTDKPQTVKPQTVSFKTEGVILFS